MTHLTRRRMLALMALAPTAAAASGGHKRTPAIIATVKSAKARKSIAKVKLEILNTSSNARTLQKVTATGISNTPLDAPVTIAGFSGVDLALELAFSGAVPGAFSLDLDFGPYGRESVSVTI